MTLEGFREAVLAHFPDAICVSSGVGDPRSHHSVDWTICVNGEPIGATAIYGEEDAWKYAAQRLFPLLRVDSVFEVTTPMDTQDIWGKPTVEAA